MEPWQKRQRFADRLSKGIGIFIVLVLLFVGTLQTTALSFLPFPKAMKFRGSHEEFIACFESHAKLSQTDGVTSYRRDVTKPENRIRLAQVKGLLGPSEARVMYIDIRQDGYRAVDKYYENANDKSRPIRKYDWVIAWLCGTGNL